MDSEHFVITRYSENVHRVRRKGSGTDGHFGQVRRDGRKWNAEIRATATGDLVRFAGVWDRKKDAVEEVRHLLGKPEQR